ncbi:MAG TPA: 2OG-Fe(II) oxygenase [Pyrinomonadaceae bacterium]|jgi:SM-20-related protein|nr:2OG-Fe(II) oxygenase [Pyrinomonadaceae bacterium]
MTSKPWPDLFIDTQFFEPALCDAIVAEMNAAAGSAATVYGSTASGTIDETVRRTFRVKPSPDTVALVIQKLLASKDAIQKHFAISLKECEDPQFLRYRQGDFFVAHQDGNTGLLRLDTEQRLISTVIFLSRECETPEPDTYCGGSLVFSNLRDRFRVSVQPGTLIAFRSETTHEVTPVTHGERYSIASWYR